jgi:hypothetical protein
MAEATVRRIPILIIIDCEPDPRLTTPGVSSPWTGFERFHDFISAQRESLALRTGAPARFSWFWRMDPQIEVTYGSADWAVRTYARQVCESERSGDESGLHTHGWRWDAGAGKWVADHGNPAWLENCVRRSFSEFGRAFGRPCRIFRFGDGWLDGPTVALIERLGARIDLTLEPGMRETPSLVKDETSTGSIPNRRPVPTRPYRPSRGDFREPDRRGDARLWMLPVTTGRAAAPRLCLRDARNLWNWLTAPEPPTVQLNLGLEPGLFSAIFDRAVSSGRRPYAAICARTDLGANTGLMAYAGRNLQAVLNHRRADRFTFVGPTEALERLTD